MKIASIRIPRTAQTIFFVDLLVIGTMTGLFANVIFELANTSVIDAPTRFQFTPIMGNVAAIVYGLSIHAALFSMGLYQRRYLRGIGLLKSGLTAGLLTWLLIAWPMATAGLLHDHVPTFHFLLVHILLFAQLICVRPIVCFYFRRFAKKRRVALVGSEAMQSIFMDMIRQTTPTEFEVVRNKYVDCKLEKDDLRTVLKDLCKQDDIDQVIVDLPPKDINALYTRSEPNQPGNLPVKLTTISNTIEQCARWSETEDNDLTVARVQSQPLARRAKYLAEIFIALCGVLFVLPVMIGVALAIKLDDGGPILYRQRRVGKNNRVFDVLKFRSMRQNAEADGKARWASVGDSRVTRIGRFIRLTRMDELPQLINIIRGDMALVGPRPERPEFVDQIASEIPGYRLRLSVRPGLTGWAQINMSYTANMAETIRKTQLDLYYIKNWSLWLDLAIIIQTVRIVLFAEGAR
ncbi:sugar transferase [Sneathiella aquimaris]|uniref:sugar transferase n=1 Tax=Sneathiella aquimaris TaxID=2599305 RepID=UPI00146E6592|nr:sugar transferase [Sneathiella aquimaris]